MAQRVAGDQRDGLLAQLFEIERQIRQRHGYSYDPEALKRHLQDAVMGNFRTETPDGILPADSFLFDKRKQGWKLLEDASRRIESVSNIEPVSLLIDGENYAGGEEMVRRARVELDCNFGQHDAEWMLTHQADIPKELRAFMLVFTGTVWQRPGGDRYVSCLVFRGGRWGLGFFWFGSGFGSGSRLVRPRT